MANTSGGRKDEPRHTGTTGNAGGTGGTGGEARRAEGAGGAMERARETASSVAERAKDAASHLGERADDAAHAVGGGMRSLAGTLRENLPREGTLGSAGSTVAHTLERGARYLEQEGFSGMMDDVAGLVRRNPIPAVLIGIGIGFLLARTTSRS